MKRTIEGLRACFAYSPLRVDDADRLVLDLDGPWTETLVEHFKEEPTRAGIAVWEGAGKVDDAGDIEWVGTWRILTADELQRLAEEKYPLRNIGFPWADEREDIEAVVSGDDQP